MISCNWRRARLSDKDWVLAERNHPEVRASALYNAPISPELHDTWWAITKDWIFIAEDTIEPLAVLILYPSSTRRDLEPGVKWSFYLTEAARGNRQSYAILKAFLDRYPNRINADVLHANEKSLRLHAKLGFVRVGQTDKYVEFVRGPRPTRIIGDIGSCHMGKIEYAKEAIDLAATAGLSSLKFQLFKGKKYRDAGNIELPLKAWPELVDYAADLHFDIFTSVFDEECLNTVLATPTKTVKFAYSQKGAAELIDRALLLSREVIVSCDPLTDNSLPAEVTRLYCIPEYPVRYSIDFAELFPRFDGFSDHTLGLHQTVNAIQAGASIVEKHVKLLKSDVNCPDSQFAVSITDLGQIAKTIYPEKTQRQPVAGLYFSN